MEKGLGSLYVQLEGWVVFPDKLRFSCFCVDFLGIWQARVIRWKLHRKSQIYQPPPVVLRRERATCASVIGVTLSHERISREIDLVSIWVVTDYHQA